MPPAIGRRLRRLVQLGAIAGILSGRRLADVRSRVRVPGVWYAGEHGLFLEDPGRRQVCLAGSRGRRQMTRVRRKLERSLRAVPGVWLESKDLALAVHYRGAPRSSVVRARRLLAEALAGEPGLRVQANKKIWDVLPDGTVNKWTAVQAILRGTGRRSARRLLFYLGDDTTDEDVFRKMKGISVVIGRKRETAARYYLRSQREVGEFLDRLTKAVRRPPGRR